jgi:hypothetical protein
MMAALTAGNERIIVVRGSLRVDLAVVSPTQMRRLKCVQKDASGAS